MFFTASQAKTTCKFNIVAVLAHGCSDGGKFYSQGKMLSTD